MRDQQDQADQAKAVAKEPGESITFWLPPSAIEDLNELVGWRTNRDGVATRSSVVAEIIRREHRREQTARAKR